MAYDEVLARRVRSLLASDDPGGVVTEKKMFGGLAFLLDGKMAVAASSQSGLMVRVDPDASGALLDEPWVRRMEMRGSAMRGWLVIEANGLRTEAQLARWVDVGIACARSLPTRQT